MTKIIMFIILLIPHSAYAVGYTDYRALAHDLLKDCEDMNKRIAVADLSYSDGRDSRDGGVVAERITTELVKAKKVKIIERKEIKKVFEELKLQHSGAIDSDSIKGIGKMLGADLMVVGTLTELPNKQLELNARLVGIESGEILSAASGRIKKDWLGQYRKLLEDQDKALEKNSRDAKTLHERGKTYTDLGKYDSAIEDFSKEIAIDPQNTVAYTARGSVYALRGKFADAIEDCRKALAIDPQNASTYNGKELEYKKALVEKDYQSAVDSNHSAKEWDPK